jgi:hypothetical protein
MNCNLMKIITWTHVGLQNGRIDKVRQEEKFFQIILNRGPSQQDFPVSIYSCESSYMK